MSTSFPEYSSSGSGLVSIQPKSQSGDTKGKNGPTANPSTPLRPTIAPSGFGFPAIWSFPPFFTQVWLQPNPATLAHQLNLWSELVLSWARFERVWTVNCDGVDGGGAVFWNRGISSALPLQRPFNPDECSPADVSGRLLPPALKQLMTHMAKDGESDVQDVDRAFVHDTDIPGHVLADRPKQSSTYLLFWRKPDEWGQLIYDWISDTGQTGSILTFYELTEGDLAETTEFRGLHPAILRKALDGLIKKGKAQIIKGDESSGDGIRFL